jgi:hypothetical protein
VVQRWATVWVIGGLSSGRDWEFFSLPPRPDQLWAHPVSYPVGTRGSFPEDKAARRKADHPPPSSAEVQNAWSYTSIPPIHLHSVVLSRKAHGQLYLTIPYHTIPYHILKLYYITELLTKCVHHFYIRGCKRNFSDWVENEMCDCENKPSVGSNTKGYGGKAH